MDQHTAHSMADLERITTAAGKAAEDGRWDVVDQCYQERGRHLDSAILRPEESERLLAMDHTIRTRVLLRQAALAALMHEHTLIRQRLIGLRQGTGALSSDSGMIRLEA